MIIWQGFGIFALIIPLLTSILCMIIGVHTPGLGVIIGAVIVGYMGYKLNNQPGRELIDPKTNETVILKRKHALFWIPMQYIAILWFVIGIALIFMQKS